MSITHIPESNETIAIHNGEKWLSLSDDEADKIGLELIELLKLKIKGGRVFTTWGGKSPAGLARSVARIILDGHKLKTIN